MVKRRKRITSLSPAELYGLLRTKLEAERDRAMTALSKEYERKLKALDSAVADSDCYVLTEKAEEAPEVAVKKPTTYQEQNKKRRIPPTMKGPFRAVVRYLVSQLSNNGAHFTPHDVATAMLSLEWFPRPRNYATLCVTTLTSMRQGGEIDVIGKQARRGGPPMNVYARVKQRADELFTEKQREMIREMRG